MKFTHLLFEPEDDVLRVKLNRPEVRNAFNPQMIEELTLVPGNLPEGTRAVVLSGEGPVFSAGGDLNWMRTSLDLSQEQNVEDATRLAYMLLALDRVPVPLIGKIHGAAMGGGVGLVSVCDYVVASSETMFSFSEAKLGIIPACIAPFVIRKIGMGHARALFTTAERFSARKAYEIGLVHQVANDGDELSQAVDGVLKNVFECGPNAVKIAKNLIFDLRSTQNDRDQLKGVAELLAEVRVSPEGQEGLRAFLEKRKPGWTKRE